ncbi:MAG: hypothetical protein J5736_03470, partial [Bacilli bacterium]|nr:hypothetical protein [Bacilli bacterium]
KAIAYGIRSLTDCELLALLISSGVNGKSAIEISAGLLGEFHGLYSLSQAPFLSLKGTKGLSKAKALALCAAFELGRRVSRLDYEQSQLSISPDSLYQEYRGKWEEERQEILCLLSLGRRGEILHEKIVYRGTRKGMLYAEADLLGELLLEKANSYYLIHNHPSGNPLPSDGDIRATTSLSEKSKELGIRMIDHVVVGHDDYFSFREARLL